MQLKWGGSRVNTAAINYFKPQDYVCLFCVFGGTIQKGSHAGSGFLIVLDSYITTDHQKCK